MKTENIITFYNLIFSSQITSFSIIIPVLFVFFQMTNKEFAPRSFNNILKDFRIISYLILAFTTMSVSGLGSYVLTFENLSIPDFVGINLRKQFGSAYYPFGLFFAFLLTFVPIVLFIRRQVILMNPTRFMQIYFKELSIKKLRLYLYKNHGLPSITYPPIEFLVEPEFIENRRIVSLSQKEEILKKHESEKTRNDKILRKIQKSYEPVFSIARNVLHYNLENSNIHDFQSSLAEFIRIHSSLCTRLEIERESSLGEGLTREYCKIILELYEASLSKQHSNFSSVVASELDSFIKQNLNLWDFKANLIIFQEIERFIDCLRIENYREASKLLGLFEQHADRFLREVKSIEVADDFFRAFSRSAEKAILKFEASPQPLMNNEHNNSLLDPIINCHSTCFDIFMEVYEKEYPLILLDANICIFRQLLKRPINENEQDTDTFVNTMVYHFLSGPRDTFMACADADNPRGAALCIMRIFEIYDLLIEHDHITVLQDSIEYAIFMGFYAASRPSPITADFLPSGATSFILAKLGKIKHHIRSIDGIVMEILIKSHSNGVIWKKCDDFLFDLAALFQSNFGLMIDWQQRKKVSDG